jgi:16S rRNA (adenine1518-N6/adenine1519-N6)-dimethyltransferase
VTHSRPAIRDLLDSASLAPRRDLGQNFVADPNTVRRIAALARVGPGDRVVEIGAGLGSLTLALADTAASITAIEVDRGVVPILRQVVADRDNVVVVEADAMTLDWSTFLASGEISPDQISTAEISPAGISTWVLVANLPYNVATPLICDLLDDVPVIERMLVMVQREAAERFAALPRTPAYGAVSVKTAYWGHAMIVGHVPASVFVPRPNVESALVEITRRQPPATEPGPLFDLVRAGFGQRRKMLRRSLAGIVAPETFEAAGIPPTARPEELDVEAWCRLTDAHLTALQ